MLSIRDWLTNKWPSELFLLVNVFSSRYRDPNHWRVRKQDSTLNCSPVTRTDIFYPASEILL